jgi:predicted DNA-binding protein (UPF0251 family)
MKAFTKTTRQRMSISAKKRCTKKWRMATSEKLRAHIDDAELTRLYTEGATQEECAVALSVSRKVIANAMKRIGIKARKRIKRDQWGANNSGWRGSKASITNKHRRIYRAFGQPSKCDVCGSADKSKVYDWANLSGDYDNPLDFKRMCRSCHRKYDNTRRKNRGT